MPAISIVRDVPVVQTPRVLQLRGLFDVPPDERSAERWTVDLDLDGDWNVGLIVGPSGAGKTTVAREMFGSAMADGHEWPHDKSIVDGFPAAMSIKDIVGLLSSVGFSSPPSWVRPYRVLSTGEQFRVSMARVLAEQPALAVVDEFTSVVDRTVAQIGSAAIQKTVRRRGQKFVACSCHYDIVDWLEPDWVYQPHTNELQRGRLRQRPQIDLTLRRVHHAAWRLFRQHHYLDRALNTAAHCFVAFWRDVPVAFSAWLDMPSGTMRRAKREHRTVCLPDYQGVGIGNGVSNACASIYAALGYVPLSTTSHPAMVRRRASDALWAMHRPSGLQSIKQTSRMNVEKRLHFTGAAARMTAGSCSPRHMHRHTAHGWACRVAAAPHTGDGGHVRESAAALRAWSDYLNQAPPRSLERLAQTYQSATKPPPPTRRVETLKEWSRQHAWQERIGAHERAIAAEREAEDAERRTQAREARLGIAANVMSESYKQFMARARDGKLTPYAALQALTLAFDTQRKDLGEPDQRVELGASDDFLGALRAFSRQGPGSD